MRHVGVTRQIANSSIQVISATATAIQEGLRDGRYLLAPSDEAGDIDRLAAKFGIDTPDGDSKAAPKSHNDRELLADCQATRHLDDGMTVRSRDMRSSACRSGRHQRADRP
jgi:hypothetical protein